MFLSTSMWLVASIYVSKKAQIVSYLGMHLSQNMPGCLRYPSSVWYSARLHDLCYHPSPPIRSEIASTIQLSDSQKRSLNYARWSRGRVGTKALSTDWDSIKDCFCCSNVSQQTTLDSLAKQRHDCLPHSFRCSRAMFHNKQLQILCRTNVIYIEVPPLQYQPLIHR